MVSWGLQGWKEQPVPRSCIQEKRKLGGAFLSLVPTAPTPCLTLISFPESVSFAFPKSRWRSQYVRDEYFIS